MVALAFLVPLAVATRQIAYVRAVSDARQQATSLVTVLGVDADPTLLTNAVASTTAGSAGRLAVHLPGAKPIGAPHTHAPPTPPPPPPRSPPPHRTAGPCWRPRPAGSPTCNRPCSPTAARWWSRST